MIKAREINKFYGSGESRFQVLKNISLTIEDGDFVVILGASGSGKSTLLNVLSGLERAESGQIFYDDTEITGQGADGLPEKEDRFYFSAVLSPAEHECRQKCEDGSRSCRKQ